MPAQRAATAARSSGRAARARALKQSKPALTGADVVLKPGAARLPFQSA